MPFIIMWHDVRIAFLFGEESDVKYKIFFENLPKASSGGLIINPLLQCNSTGKLPNWINSRIPQNESNKFDYLRKTQGRLETDDIWFQAV